MKTMQNAHSDFASMGSVLLTAALQIKCNQMQCAAMFHSKLHSNRMTRSNNYAAYLCCRTVSQQLT